MIRILAFIFCGFLTLTPATPAFAQDRLLEIVRLIDAGEFDAAQKKIDEIQLSELDFAYLNARAELVKKNWDAAIAQFRALLKRQPKFVLARVGLAQALEGKEQFVAAELQYRRLIITDKNPQSRAVYRQAVSRVAAQKRIGLSGSLSFAPSQNINRATFRTSLFGEDSGFTIDETQQSGVGVFAGLNGYVRTDPNKTSQLRLDWSVSGKEYEGRQFDSYTGYTGLQYIHSLDKGFISFGPYVRRVWDYDNGDGVEGEPYELGVGTDSKGLSFTISYRIGEAQNLRFSWSHERIDDRRSGDPTDLSRTAALTWRSVLDPRTYVETTVKLTDLDRFVAYNGYWGQEARFSFGRFFPRNIEGRFTAYRGVRDYKANFGGFFTNFPRRDEYTGLEIEAKFNSAQVFSFTPKVSCRIENGRSNIEFGDVRIRECAAELSQNF